VTLTDERLGCLLVVVRNSFGTRSACDSEYLKVGDSLCRVAVPRYQVVFRCRRSVTSRTESPRFGRQGHERARCRLERGVSDRKVGEI
jgi:hypothetical protein